MLTLGGSLFVHNGIAFDYCFREAIASLCGVCDEVVALDASSDDGTAEAMQALTGQFANLKVITGAEWNCAPDNRRLSILANKAISHLTADWHFMLQADEVLHERSYPFIRKAIESQYHDSFMVRRFNLFGDANHCFRLDLPQDRKPCSDSVIRLARREYKTYSDAESLHVKQCAFDPVGQLDNIAIVHYGMVRDDARLIDKSVDMQGWFYGRGGVPDPRIVAMREDRRFAWEKLHSTDELMPLPISHPECARQWSADRQACRPTIASH